MGRVTAIAVIALFGLVVSLTQAQEPEPVPRVGTDASEVLSGTPGRDSLYGRGGDDVLLGAAGDDELDGGPGADTLSGGPGNDAVSYEGAPVTVTLDGIANDGVPGERDNVLRDTEYVYGTAGPDTIIGNDRDNILEGDAGNDRIVGGPGVDALFGGDGDDTINSRDGSPDDVQCGPGADTASIDSRDTTADCEDPGTLPTTENFTILTRDGNLRRAARFRLRNIKAGSRITFACVSRCRPRTSSKRIVYRMRSARPRSGNVRVVDVRISRSPFVAGATLEVGVKARKATPRCRRVKLVSKGGVIGNLDFPKGRCSSVAREG